MKNDRYIVNEMCKLKLNTGELIKINTCRIHLQIGYIGDMTSVDSKYILTNFTTGFRRKYPHSSYRWLIQPAPTTSAWKIWKRTLQQIF